MLKWWILCYAYFTTVKKKVHFALDQGKFLTKESMPILFEDQLNQVLDYQYIGFKSLPVILM